MSEPELLTSEIEEDLRASVRDLLARRVEPAALTAMSDGDRSAAAPLWQALAVELGLAGLVIPESAGGAGASVREAAVVAEELGRVCAPVPFLTSAGIATTALTHVDPPEIVAPLLGELAAGERTAALVVPFSTLPEGELPDLADGGTVRSVAGALEADVLLILSDGALRVMEADRARVEPVTSLDMTRQVADVSVPADSGAVVAEDGVSAVRAGLLTGAVLLAAEQHGVASWCLGSTIEYLGQRRQFGRVVGGFQAIKHRLADLYCEVEQAGATARYAAVTLAEGDPDAPVAAAVAQSWCSDVAVHAAEEAVQLHGGIGMTWEHPVHLYLKRAKADQLALGTPGAHRTRLADLVDLPS